MVIQRKRFRVSAFDAFNIVFMILLSLSILFPFWDMLVRSLSSSDGAGKLEILLLPKDFTLSSYKFALMNNGILNAYIVTILRTVIGTILSLTIVLLAAYPLSKRELPFRTQLTFLFLIPMFISGGLIPSYLINRQLGLVDNFMVYILPGALGIYNVVLARNYIMSIDKSLEESAFMDGAGYGTILLHIIIPLTKPIIATLALWIAVGHWNSWMDCLIYIRSERLVVVQMILRRMQDLSQLMSEDMQQFMANDPNVRITGASVRMATTIITVLPIVTVYPFMQKYFVKGIMVGSLKG